MQARLSLSLPLALASALAGCADLQPIPADTCGNGVVEATEDCDLFADPALGDGTACGQPTGPGQQRCRYVCTADGATACPDGWACNRSGVCQFASGAYTQAQGSPFGLTAETLAAGDIDGDRALDLIGISGSAVRMRFGAGNGQFPTAFDISTPAQTGQLAIGHLDVDQSLDALIPIGGGLIVVRGQPDRSVAPIAALTDVGMLAGDAFHAAHVRTPAPPSGIASTVLVFMVEDGPSVAVRAPGGELALPPALERRIATLTPVREVDIGGQTRGATVSLAFAGDDRVFLLEMEGNGQQAALTRRADVLLSDADTIRRGLLWADVDSDDDLDLVISVTSGGQERVATALQAADGTFSAAVVDPRFDALRDDCLSDAQIGIGEAAACSRFPAAAGDLDGDGRADYVAANAVYLAPSGGPLLRASDRLSADPWTEAVIADFNRDGAPDIAAVSDDDAGIDFLLGNLSGVFTHARIETDGAPTSLVTGDFDGDLVTDVGLAEVLDDEAFASVVFGESLAPPRALIKMGRFDEIHYLDVGHAPVPNELTDELLVDTSDPDEAVLSLFHGNSQRQMASPLEFGPPPFAGVDAAVIGDFTGDGVADIAALTDVNTGALLWLLHGPIDGDSPDPGDAIPLSDDVSPDAFDFACARWLVGDVDGDSVDELIAVDGDADCLRPDQTASAPRLLVLDIAPDNTLTPTLGALASGLTGVRELSLADLDLDGRADLVVVYGGRAAPDACSTNGGAGVAVYWDPSDTTEVTVVEGLRASEIPSAAAINADDDPALELAIWTPTSLSIADLDDQRSFQLADIELDASLGCGAQILAGDVDGDELPDLILGDQERVEVHVAVSHIDARDRGLFDDTDDGE